MRLRVGSGLVALVVLAGCGGGAGEAPTTTVAESTPSAEPAASVDEAHGTWERVARSPSSARNNAVFAWTGEEVLVFGGERFHCGGPLRGSRSCAAPADPPLRDGAAYNPDEDSWRRVAEAPVPMLYASTAVVGHTVFVAQEKGMFAYDLTQDAWRRLPAPAAGYATLAAIGDLLVAYRTGGAGQDHFWDAEAARWRALPLSPGPVLGDREMVDAGGVGVLVGLRADKKGRYRTGLGAVTLDPATRRWTALRFADGRDAAGLVTYSPQPLHAAEGKIVSASFFGDRLPWVDDGPLIGGVLDLDQGWSRLPARPVPAVQRERDAAIAALESYDSEDPKLPYVESFSWLNVGGDGFVVAGRWAYDVERGTWQHVPDRWGPVRLAEASAVWAGDRVFAWGGSRGGSDVVATGWTWRPHRPLLGLG